MPAPLVPIAVAGAVKSAGKSWTFWLGLSAFVGSGAISLSVVWNQFTASAINLWPLLAMAGAFLVIRQVVKEYFKVKRKSSELDKEK